MTKPNIVLSNPEHYCLTEQKITEDGDNFLVQVKVTYDCHGAAHSSVDWDDEKWITEDITFEIPSAYASKKDTDMISCFFS